MVKQRFFVGKHVVESIGSMEEIEGMMDYEIAYRVLLGACYPRTEYKEISAVCSEIMDSDEPRISCTPLEAADRLNKASPDLPLPEDIFLFLEKAYLDGYALLKSRGTAFQLGRLYSEERYNHIDDPKAAFWFERSAEAGSGEAEFRLGKCCLLGRGVPRDYEKAFHRIVKWALMEDQNTEALYLLGDMYRDGLYVAKDKFLANDLYLRALNLRDYDSGIAFAQVQLRVADFYMNEIGGKYGYGSALALYQEAECGFFSYLRSHPQEAQAGIVAARAGQTRARKKYKKALMGNGADSKA